MAVTAEGAKSLSELEKALYVSPVRLRSCGILFRPQDAIYAGPQSYTPFQGSHACHFG